MATILSGAIVTQAKDAVDAYVQTATSLYGELESEINSLTSSNFIGDASDGYKSFFDTKVKPALTENLTDPGTSMTANLKSILDSIQEQLLNTVDTQLGNSNRGV